MGEMEFKKKTTKNISKLNDPSLISISVRLHGHHQSEIINIFYILVILYKLNVIQMCDSHLFFVFFLKKNTYNTVILKICGKHIHHAA